MSIIATIKRCKVKKYFNRNFQNVEIGKRFNFESYKMITFKGTCYIGPDAFWSAKGSIEIGNNVIFGPRTVLWTYNHDYMSDISIPYGGSDILGKIIICDNVWVGMNSVILPGVTIEEGAIIGANTVIAKDIPKCAVVVGNPARIIKYRDEEKYKKLKSENKFYLNRKFNV